MRRAVALWLVLFAAYAATLGLPAFGASQYGGAEPHYLLAARSIVSDGDVDLRNEYAERSYRDWYPYPLSRDGRLTDGHAYEPQGIGFPLLIAPAYALGGPVAVQLMLAAIAALAFVLAAALARRIVPDPWATIAALGCGLSPPALAYGTAVYPQLSAGAALAGAALLALRVRELPRIRWVSGAAVLLAALPWLSPEFVVPDAVVALALLHWLRRRAPGFALLVAAETMLFSAVLYIVVDDRLYGGLTPLSADGGPHPITGAAFPGGYADRAYRLVALWLDRSYGALRWAPFVAMAFYGLWLLWRSHRDRLARALPDRREVEVVAALCALVCAAQVFAAAFLAPTMFGFWFPGLHLLAAFPAATALCAWGLRRAPRTGGALLGVTAVTSVWLYVQLRVDGGGIVGPSSRAPLGPLEKLLPLFASGSAYANAVLAGAIAAGVLLVVSEVRRARVSAS